MILYKRIKSHGVHEEKDFIERDFIIGTPIK